MKIFNNLKQISKAYVEGIYADTPQNRKLGRVGMSYKEYEKKLKDEKEEKAEKKYYLIQSEDGDEFMLEESKVSQEKILELAEQYARDQINYNGRSIVKFSIQENTYDWKDEDFDTKSYDWFNFTAKKHGDKIEISIYDFNNSKFLRNDTLDRELRNDRQKYERQRKKDDEEFDKKFGWMKELVDSWHKKNTKKAEEWASSITNKETKRLAVEAAVKILQLGVELPKIKIEKIPKQENNFQPICGYDHYNNELIIDPSAKISEKGKDYLERGWNSQDNPILHELSHYLAKNMNPNGYYKKDFPKKIDKEKVEKELSKYATYNLQEFNAELIAGILSGKTYSDYIMDLSNLKLNKEGYTANEIFKEGIDFYKKSEEMLDRVLKRK